MTIDAFGERLDAGLGKNGITVHLILGGPINRHSFEADVGHVLSQLGSLAVYQACSVVMLVSMRSMFPSRVANIAIVVAAAVIFIASFAAMRTQAAVGDSQFLRSMIPHHSGAILMCEQAKLSDQEIVTLCRNILDAQKREIAQMTAILERLGKQ